MMKRTNDKQIDKDMEIPGSPAFVSSYDALLQKGGYTKLQKPVQFAKEKNIPFCSEEDKYYRVR